MKTYIQPGKQLSVAAPYTVTAGQGVLIGQLFGCALGDALNGAAVDILTEGVVSLPKASADVFATVGLPVYYNVTDHVAASHTDTDSNSAGETSALIGITIEAAGAGVTSVKVKLAPSPVVLV